MVQVLYQHRMYTATLLLSHRFMAIVPVLIAGFYLLYLGKTARCAAWGRVARTVVHGVALVAFVFVAWTWIEEHTLAAAPPEVWVAPLPRPRHGARRSGDRAASAGVARLAAAAFAVATVWLARARLDGGDVRRLGLVGLGGLVVLAGGVFAVAAATPGHVPQPAMAWLALGAVAHAVTAIGFVLLVTGRDALGRGSPRRGCRCCTSRSPRCARPTGSTASRPAPPSKTPRVCHSSCSSPCSRSSPSRGAHGWCAGTSPGRRSDQEARASTPSSVAASGVDDRRRCGPPPGRGPRSGPSRARPSRASARTARSR